MTADITFVDVALFFLMGWVERSRLNPLEGKGGLVKRSGDKDG